MKILITTVFKTENCGSYLQAWALKEQLALMGNDVFFRDYNISNSSRWNKNIGIVKCCVKLRLKRALSILEKSFCYKKLQKCFKNSDVASSDICIFGSDTLWNFDDDLFKKEAHFFTGFGIEKPCYTYSMSVGSTPKESFLESDEVVKNISKFKKIAVRDSYSENTISAIYPKDQIVRTVDPTLLFDKKIYIDHFNSKVKFPDKFLLVYYFGPIPAEIWGQLQIFSVKNGLKIVNVGLYEKTYDVSVTAIPQNFISAFNNAQYVFTNTFHGCVFSTLFNKQFATDGIKKRKIASFLDEFNLNDRIVRVDNDLINVLENKVDYDAVNCLIDKKRKISVEYLKSVLGEVNTDE